MMGSPIQLENGDRTLHTATPRKREGEKQSARSAETGHERDNQSSLLSAVFLAFLGASAAGLAASVAPVVEAEAEEPEAAAEEDEGLAEAEARAFWRARIASRRSRVSPTHRSATVHCNSERAKKAYSESQQGRTHCIHAAIAAQTAQTKHSNPHSNDAAVTTNSRESALNRNAATTVRARRDRLKDSKLMN